MDYLANSGGSEWSMNMARSVFPNVDWDKPQAGPSQRQDREPEAHNQQPVSPDGPVGHPCGMPRDLQQWLEGQGLSPDTISKLVDNGFIAKALIGLIQEADIITMNIQPLAQQRLIHSVIKKMLPPVQGTAQARGTATTSASGSTATVLQGDMTRQLADLFSTLPSSSSSDNHSGPQGGRIDLNPLSYLLPQKRQKYLDIADFVQTGYTESEESILEGEGGSQVILKSGPRKPKLENVTPMQWSAANVRILMELLQEGQLQKEHIYDYLAYTVKVSELADSYLWTSVLHYDRAYRQLQAQHHFRWGSDSPHLGTLHLRVRQTVGQTRPVGKGSNNPALGNTGQKPVCRLFNRNQCPFGAACKYKHVCSAPDCKESHPLAFHGKKFSDDQKNKQGRD